MSLDLLGGLHYLGKAGLGFHDGKQLRYIWELLVGAVWVLIGITSVCGIRSCVRDATRVTLTMPRNHVHIHHLQRLSKTTASPYS